MRGGSSSPSKRVSGVLRSDSVSLEMDSGATVEELLGRLNLTAEESNAVSVDDTLLEGLATSDRAIIGKVLSSSVLHIQTIMSGLRPAWGNPKGLEAKSVGDNIFIVEFGSRQDMVRMLEGSPWCVGKKAVLVQQFDPSLRPSEVNFNNMATWVRIYDLPFGLMNNNWGRELAKRVGSVKLVEVDASGRAWGPYLRARVEVDISKPLVRYVSVFSEKKKTIDIFNVRYEKLPSYCYSCGIIGHSSIECPTPAERGEDGLLPYGKDLRAPDDNNKKKGVEPTSRNTSSMSHDSSNEDRNDPHVTSSKGNTGGSTNLGDKEKHDQEKDALSLRQKQGIRGKKVIDNNENLVKEELTQKVSKGQGTKRKQSRQTGSRVSDERQSLGTSHDAMALIVADQQLRGTGIIENDNLEMFSDLDGEETVKKQRKDNDQIVFGTAEAAGQPRRGP